MSERPLRHQSPKALLALVGVALVVLLELHPWSSHRLTPAADPLASPPYPQPAGLSAQAGGTAVLCVVSPPDQDAQPFSRLNVSAFWTSLLLPVAGACPPLPWTELERTALPSARLLVLSMPALEALEGSSPAFLSALAQWVAQGGMVWLEQPGPAVRAALGVQGQPLGAAQAELPTAEGVTGLLDARLPAFPYQPVQLPGAIQPLLSSLGPQSGAPLAWLERRGSGALLILNFELSRLLLRVMQGQPHEDYSFPVQPRRGALAGIPVPSDLTAANPDWTRPVALLLMEALWRVSAQEVFLPGWWRHPDGAPGSFIMSHDEEGFGDRSLFMAEEEERLGQRTSAFVLSAPLTRRGASNLQQRGMELLLHWHRGFMGGNTEPITLGPLVVGARALTLAEQWTRVETLVGRGLPPITRIHGLQWDADWDSTFRRMVASGLAMDSSYGPVGALPPWRFGTLEPFFPLDRQGHLLPILEAPFALQDDEAPPFQTMKGLIPQAAAEGLTLIPIVHMNTMAHKPSNEVMRTWLESFGWARSAGLWPGTLGRLLTFHQDRLQARVHVEAEGAGGYRLRLVSAGHGLWLRVPGHVRGRLLQGLRHEGAPLEPADLRILPEGDALLRAEAGAYELRYP